LLLLDEPFSNLDATLRARVRADVHEILARAGATTIFVTHDQDEALSLADRLAVMDRGRVLQVGTPEEVYRRPVRREVALLIGEANLLPGQADQHDVVCELGRLPLLEATSGAVDVLIRPEAICVQARLATMRADGEIARREFFGHDQRLLVRLLDSGRLLTVRTGPEPLLRVGDQVVVQVRGAVTAFPA
jgi:iron(III) transport system ATP-binding protein